MRQLFDTTRRDFLKAGTLAAGLGALRPSRLYASHLASQHGEIYRQLGVRPLINAYGTNTIMTGSLLVPQARDAMVAASQHFVSLEELQRAAGVRIAELLEAEAAMVTSGSAGAILLATAACVTEGDDEKIRRVPNTAGMKNEVIIPRAHRVPFDHAARTVGVQLIEVDTVAEVEAAISAKTAMLFFVNISEPRGEIRRDEFIRVGKRADIPVFNDAAAELPPVENLARFVAEGWDLVCVSGGKALRGPQASGILWGRRDLIEAAHKNNNPNGDTIGRAAKVGKEEIMALLAALEVYVRRDHDAEERLWHGFLSRIATDVKRVRTVRTEVFTPPARNVPNLRVEWDAGAVSLTYDDCRTALWDGEPRIAVRSSDDGIFLNPMNLQPGEDRIVGLRVADLLRAATI